MVGVLTRSTCGNESQLPATFIKKYPGSTEIMCPVLSGNKKIIIVLSFTRQPGLIKMKSQEGNPPSPQTSIHTLLSPGLQHVLDSPEAC